MTNTRHIPDLNSARECINQAVVAVRADDPGTVDDCVTAALQYLQPDVEHVKDDIKPATLYRVHIVVTGAEDATVSKPLDKYTAENLMLNVESLAVTGRGVIKVDIAEDRLPVSLNARYIDTWFMTVHDPRPPA